MRCLQGDSALLGTPDYAALYDLPTPTPGRGGRPRTYGERLGNAESLATTLQPSAQAYTLNLYGTLRTVMAVDRVVMLKTLRCRVRVVWVFRTTQWVALVTTDLDLSVAQMIEYDGARWKIEIDQSWCLHTIEVTTRGHWRRHRCPRGDAVSNSAAHRVGHAGARARRRRPRRAIGDVRRARLAAPVAALCRAS